MQGKFVLHPVDGRRIPIICDAELVDMSFGTGAVKVGGGCCCCCCCCCCLTGVKGWGLCRSRQGGREAAAAGCRQMGPLVASSHGVDKILKISGSPGWVMPA